MTGRADTEPEVPADAVPFVADPHLDDPDVAVDPDGTADTDDDDDHDDDDDVIVLPWWQHPVNIVTIAVTLALLAGMAGWWIGTSTAGDDPNEVDIGFLQDMREHHEQAVAMSFLYRELPDTEPGLRTVAQSIAFGQGIEIGRMIQLLRDFDADEANMGDASMTWMGMSAEVGMMPGMASEAELLDLAASSGAEADELFVELMTAHHLGGIEMARFAADEAATDEVRRMAASMAAAQVDEIGEMERLLDE